MFIVMKDIKKISAIGLLACCMLVLTWPRTSSALTVRDKYHQADACYKKLSQSAKKQKYRDQWFACIDKFQAVYRHDPSGPWAPAGLYMSAKLYQELYRHSLKGSDRKEALDIYERIVKRFPQSQYRQKAQKAIRAFSSSKHAKVDSRGSRTSKSTAAKGKYFAAEKCYDRLLKSAKKQKYRDQWFACIDKFRAVYRHDPSGPWAPAGLYMAGKLYQGSLWPVIHKSGQTGVPLIFTNRS